MSQVAAPVLQIPAFPDLAPDEMDRALLDLYVGDGSQPNPIGDYFSQVYPEGGAAEALGALLGGYHTMSFTRLR